MLTDNRLTTIYYRYVSIELWKQTKSGSLWRIGSLYKAVDHPRKLRWCFCLALKSVLFWMQRIFGGVDESFEVYSKWENLNNPIRTLQRHSGFSISSKIVRIFSLLFLIQLRRRKKRIQSTTKFQARSPEFSWFDSLPCIKRTDINTSILMSQTNMHISPMKNDAHDKWEFYLSLLSLLFPMS